MFRSFTVAALVAVASADSHESTMSLEDLMGDALNDMLAEAMADAGITDE